MYSASEAFHAAVANNAHQIALLLFEDAVFTNDDIDVERGIEFNDYFNLEEDISIGQALSNEISFSLFNDTGLLDNYEFGDFTATIGAQIANDTVTQNGIIQAQSTNHTYVAYNSSPYLKRDGTAVQSQPSRKIETMVIYDGIVYCRLANNAIVAYKDSNGSTTSVSLNNFMKAQLAKWKGKGISYANKQLRIWEGTKRRTYEFVPLGQFIAERPNVPTVNAIDFTCYDLMQRFDIDMPSDADIGITYPCTLGHLYQKLCLHVNVPYRSINFINSDATISSRPDEFNNATMRDVLRWVAEAAASNARIDRDGYMVLDWLRDSTLALNEGDYADFNPYWYQTKTVSKLYNRSTQNNSENTIGSGDIGYLIQDNPLLKGAT